MTRVSIVFKIRIPFSSSILWVQSRVAVNEDITDIGILIGPLIIGDNIIGISIEICIVACPAAYLYYSHPSSDVKCCIERVKN